MKTRTHKEKASAHIEKGEWKEALHESTKATEQDPSDGVAYEQCALAKNRLYDFNGALIDANQAIKFGHTDAFVTKGIILGNLNRLDEAESAFNEAIKFDPKRGAIHYFLGRMYSDLGKTDLAIGAIKTALKLNPRLKKQLLDQMNGIKNKDDRLTCLISAVLNRSNFKGILFSLSKGAKTVSLTRGDFSRLAKDLEAELKAHEGEVKVDEGTKQAYLQDYALQKDIVAHAKDFPHLVKVVRNFHVGTFKPAEVKLHSSETIMDSDKQEARYSSCNRFGHPAIGNSLL